MVCFFNDTATTEIYTLSLHDALPICTIAGLGALAADLPPNALVIFTAGQAGVHHAMPLDWVFGVDAFAIPQTDRKSTRLNSSHANISYAVFCLNKKNLNLVLL